MALRAGYKGIKKYIADILNAMNPGDGIATDKEIVTAISDVESVIGTVENGTTASQAYAVGSHFIRNGKFCTVTQAISSGDTLTVNTNYVEGALGDIICKTYQKSSVTVPAGGYVTISIPSITGYTPIIANIGSGGTGVSTFLNTQTAVDQNHVITAALIRNTDVDSHTWNIRIHVVYVKSNTVIQETLS